MLAPGVGELSPAGVTAGAAVSRGALAAGGGGCSALPMRLLFFHLHLVHRHVHTLGWVLVDRLGGPAPGGSDLGWRQPARRHLLTHRRQLLLHRRRLQAPIRARRDGRYRGFARATLRIEAVLLQHRLTVSLQKIQHLRPFLLRIRLPRRDRRAPLHLAPIPV